jgi:hypothetical protein
MYPFLLWIESIKDETLEAITHRQAPAITRSNIHEHSLLFNMCTLFHCAKVEERSGVTYM